MKNILSLILLTILTMSQAYGQFTDSQKQYLDANQILVNGGFKNGLKGWTSTTVTPSIETSVVFFPGVKSLKFLPSAQAFTLVQSSTANQDQFADGVQGMIAVRIKTDVALQVCSVLAGTVSTTNCVTTSTDAKWNLYKVPTVLGATSNGISIASVGSVTGTVYVDHAFVGPSDGKQDVSATGPWITYTPTFTGFGTVATQSFKWRQVGSSVEIQGRFTGGTPTAVEARISLPNSYTVNSSVTGMQAAGVGAYSASASISTYVIIEPSVSYFGIGVQNGTNAGLTKATGSTTLGAGNALSVSATIPVNELNGSVTTYTSSCGAACEDVLSAKLSSTGVVSDENIDWITGNCVQEAGAATCTLKTGIATVGMNCHTTGVAATRIPIINSSTSTTVVFELANTSGASTAAAQSISCQKQGVDAINSRLITGSFKEMSTFPGIKKPKTCGAWNAGASSVTACTSSPCTEYYDQCQTVSPCTRSDTGVYNCVYANGTFAANTPVYCNNNGASLGASNRLYISDANGSITSSVSNFNSSFALSDTWFNTSCTGEAP